jgi:hypothetical protein
VLSIAKYGVGLLPSWNYMQALAVNWRDPTSSPLLHYPDDFRLRSPVSAVASGWLHLTAGPRFLGFHLVLALIAIVVPLMMTAVRRSVELRALVGLLLIGGAIPAVLLSWIGSYDPVSLGAAAVAALAIRREVAALAWMVFAFNNAPEAALAFAGVAIVLLVDQRREAVARLAFGAAGGIAGYVGIRVLDNVWGGGTGDGTLVKFYGFSRYTSSAEHYWPLIIVSALGVGWLLAASPESWRLPAVRVFFGVSVLACFVVPLLALDDTRITAGVLWAPVLTTATVVVRRLPVEDTRAVAARMAPVALLLVLVVVWDGSLVYPGWSGLADMVRYLTGHQAIPVA